MRLSRGLVMLVAVGLVVVVSLGAIVLVGLPMSPEQRQAEVRRLLDLVSVAVQVDSVAVVATGAFADFGIDEGVRLVRVRIVDQFGLSVEIASDKEIVLAEPPKICLVGPYSAPDDAGLEDRCWGEPDTSELLAGQLPVDSRGRPVLRAGNVLRLDEVLRRGDVRCDYPPGEWLVQVKLNPIVGDAAAGAEYIDDVPFTVPIPDHGPLPLLLTDQTRYCGLATLIYRQQGEPEVIEP